MTIQSVPVWNIPMLPQFKQFQVDLIRFGTQRWGQAESEFGWKVKLFPTRLNRHHSGMWCG